MGRKKRERLEFRFYEIPAGESALALFGEQWTGTYGHTDICMHFHNLFEIGYCHRGRGLLVLGEKEHVYEDGMISAIPANYPHITVSEDEDSWEFLFLDPEELIREMVPDDSRRQAEMLAIINKRADVFPEEEQPELAGTVRKILRELRQKRPHYRESVRHLVQIYLIELIRIQEARAAESFLEASVDSAALNQILPALRFIDENYMRPIRAAELASRCGLSEPQFRRVFEDRVRMVPMDYLNLIRIQKACKFMQRRDLPMELVAAECGFSSISAFNRNFRKYLDITPYQWKLNKDNYPSRLMDYTISAQRGRWTL